MSYASHGVIESTGRIHPLQGTALPYWTGVPAMLKIRVMAGHRDREVTGVPTGARLCAARALACVSVLAWLSPCLAASAPVYKVAKTIALKPHLATRSDWVVTAYQAQPPADPDSIPDDPAKLCFSRGRDEREDCTKITSGMPNDPGDLFNYQTVKRLDIVPLKTGVRALEFQAEFSGGGSGLGEQISLWTYSQKGDSFWPALTITSNESLQYKIVSTGPLAGYVISADAAWQSGEAHFAAHQFEITVYRLSGQFYLKVLSYLTTQKYGGEDEGKPTDAIGGEMPRIRSLLKAIRQ